MSDMASDAVEGILAGAGRSDSLSDAELVALLGDLEVVGRRVDAARVRVAGELAHRSRRELGTARLSARLGCRTPSEALQRVTGVAGVTAGRRIKLALATRADHGLTGEPLPARFEEVGRALRAGELGIDAAQHIVGTLEPTLRVADPAHVATAERELVAAAVERWGERADARADDAAGPDDDEHGDDADGTDGSGDAHGTDDDDEAGTDARADGARYGRGAPVLDADGVRLQARLWAQFLDPDGAAPDERDEERRFLTLHTPRRGLVPMNGLLLPEVAAALRRYADACTNPRTPAVADPTQESDTDQPDPRSRAQVMHDVLAAIVGVAARVVDAPSVAGNAPTLVVVARAEDLASGEGVALADDGTPVSIAAARHVGCAGAVQRITTDTSGRVVGLWSAERCFTGGQRRAIAARDGGCVVPGCHVPPAWCEVHHVIEHAQDPNGTHTDNGVLLCWHHHRTLDTSGWRIRMLDGLPWISPPTWLDARRTWHPAHRGTTPRRAGPGPQ
jgi:5-methylcytosine-specific restriction protein A